LLTRSAKGSSNKWFDDDCRIAKINARSLERRYQRTNNIFDKIKWEQKLKLNHNLFNKKRTAATMTSIREAQGNCDVLRRALNKTMGNTASTLKYVHTADEFADYYENKIAAIRHDTANAMPPIFATTTPITMLQFATVSARIL